MENSIDYNHFNKVDIRVGTILEAEINLSLKTPSIVMLIDFGEKIGIKKSSAQLTANYEPNKIINKGANQRKYVLELNFGLSKINSPYLSLQNG